MRFLARIFGRPGGQAAGRQGEEISGPSHQQFGRAAELLALQHLQAQGLRLEARNYRTPGRGGGELDLVFCEPDGTLVFVEVRARRSAAAGGAAASIDGRKRQRIVRAAHHYLQGRGGPEPACRFDVVLFDGKTADAQWIKAAFDAGALR